MDEMTPRRTIDTPSGMHYITKPEQRIEVLTAIEKRLQGMGPTAEIQAVVHWHYQPDTVIRAEWGNVGRHGPIVRWSEWGLSGEPWEPEHGWEAEHTKQVNDSAYRATHDYQGAPTEKF